MTRLLYYWAICLEDQILPLDSRLEVTLILVRRYREGWPGRVQENEQEAEETDEKQTSPGLVPFISSKGPLWNFSGLRLGLSRLSAYCFDRINLQAIPPPRTVCTRESGSSG